MKIPPAIAKIAPNGRLSVAQKRRFFLNLALKRAKPGTGSGLAFLQTRTAMNPWPDLRPILINIPWAIVGAVATRAYMPERQTKDLDILVHADDGEEAIRCFTTAGYHLGPPLGIPDYLLYSPEGVEIDLIFGGYPWLKEALAQPQQDQAGYPVLDLPYLVVLKGTSARTQDMADVSRMLGLATEDELERVHQVVKQYVPDMVDDLEAMIYLGQLEFQSPNA